MRCCCEGNIDLVNRVVLIRIIGNPLAKGSSSTEELKKYNSYCSMTKIIMILFLSSSSAPHSWLFWRCLCYVSPQKSSSIYY